MISCWCSPRNVTVCSTSRAKVSAFNSLRVILATKTSSVFGNYMVSRPRSGPPAFGPPAMLMPMYLKILAHPVFPGLNFHMPMIVSRPRSGPPAFGPPAMLMPMYLKIVAHPVFPGLNFHMPMIVDLSHPLIMLQGENGSGKSTLLHSIHYAFRGEQVEGFVYRLETGDLKPGTSYLFDAEQHNPRTQLELFKDQPQ